MTTPSTITSQQIIHAKPQAAGSRLGFLGLGWIGRMRMASLSHQAHVEIAALADPANDCLHQARELAPAAQICRSLDELLDQDLDGIVIATPSALHAEQAVQALEAGFPVFCQKPLGRTAAEVKSVLAAARRHNRLLGVDLSYRHTQGIRQLRHLIREKTVGDLFAGEFVFHNAYGPDKQWFYNPRLSGGGCVIDLGVHLVDLALWLTASQDARLLTSTLYSRGSKLSPPCHDVVEDYGAATLELPNGSTVQLSCSWNISAGCDAAIGVTVYGTKGALSWHNVNGSFFDFQTEQFTGRERITLSEPPDDWGGRSLLAWTEQLATSHHYRPEIESTLPVARLLDQIYQRT